MSLRRHRVLYQDNSIISPSVGVWFKRQLVPADDINLSRFLESRSRNISKLVATKEISSVRTRTVCGNGSNKNTWLKLRACWKYLRHAPEGGCAYLHKRNVNHPRPGNLGALQRRRMYSLKFKLICNFACKVKLSSWRKMISRCLEFILNLNNFHLQGDWDTTHWEQIPGSS